MGEGWGVRENNLDKRGIGVAVGLGLAGAGVVLVVILVEVLGVGVGEAVGAGVEVEELPAWASEYWPLVGVRRMSSPVPCLVILL